MSRSDLCRGFAALGAVLLLALAGACSTLRPVAAPPASVFSLDRARADAQPALRTRAGWALPAVGPTLVVQVPRAAPGLDSRRIAYVREPHRLEFFAHSEWVDTPARMLAPLIVAAVETGSGVYAVVLAPSTVAGDIRLDVDLLRLQQEFGVGPSRVRFTLRATLVEAATRRVLATRDFDLTEPATSDDPYGGVLAANRAVQAGLLRLAAFVAEAAGHWQAASAEIRDRAGVGRHGQ